MNSLVLLDGLFPTKTKIRWYLIIENNLDIKMPEKSRIVLSTKMKQVYMDRIHLKKFIVLVDH